MAHLYFKAKESFASQQPPEVRILKHLLSIDDPRQRMVALEEAFAPGPAGADMQLDYLSTYEGRGRNVCVMCVHTVQHTIEHTTHPSPHTVHQRH